jgi:hypothetical protein
MTIDQALVEWNSRSRRMGCVSASEWFSKRVSGFYSERLVRYTKEGDLFEHCVATNGSIRVDLTPHLDAPEEAA